MESKQFNRIVTGLGSRPAGFGLTITSLFVRVWSKLQQCMAILGARVKSQMGDMTWKALFPRGRRDRDSRVRVYHSDGYKRVVLRVQGFTVRPLGTGFRVQKISAKRALLWFDLGGVGSACATTIINQGLTGESGVLKTINISIKLPPELLESDKNYIQKEMNINKKW